METPEGSSLASSARAHRDGFDPSALGRAGEHLTVEAPADGLDERGLDALLEPAALADAIEAHGASVGADTLPVAASSWAKHLVTILAPGVLVAWTLQETGLDASPSNLTVHLDEGSPRRVRILEPGRVSVGSDARDRGIETLFGASVEPLAGCLDDLAGLEPSRVWSTVGVLVAHVFHHVPEERAGPRVAGDRERLLGADAAAWVDRENPLAGVVEPEPLPAGAPVDAYPVREACCLKVALPGKGACRSCPRLSADQRARRLAERGGEG